MAKVWKVVDILNLFASTFLIILLVIVLLASLRFWTDTYTLSLINEVALRDRLYSIGVIIAIVTVISQWIEGRAVSIVGSIKNLKGGNNNGRRRREEEETKPTIRSEPITYSGNDKWESWG